MSGRTKRKLTLDISALIRGQVEENELKRRTGLRKQIKRKIDIHEYLLSQGYKIGYTTVCNHIRSMGISDREAYIRQVYLPGEECEFDWGETKSLRSAASSGGFFSQCSHPPMAITVMPGFMFVRTLLPSWNRIMIFLIM